MLHSPTLWASFQGFPADSKVLALRHTDLFPPYQVVSHNHHGHDDDVGGPPDTLNFLTRLYDDVYWY